MAQKSPNSVDVIDIQFKLHGKTKIFNVNDSNGSNSNLLAVSSAQGLLFAGDPENPEFKVFMSKNLVDNESTDSKIIVRIVPLPAKPITLACSCDGGLLAVNYMQNNSSILHVFDVPSLLTANISSSYKIPLSADGNSVCRQILWNPVIASNLAVILKNGGLTMYTLKEAGQYEMHNLDKRYQVQCGCWSPKGKQIVLGFANGKLQQFKPELTAAKTIVCPPGIHPGPFSTIAVHWLSTFQFAVAFLQDGNDNVPSLYIVNAPKGGNPAYINYYDVCYTTGQRQHQITFTHIQQWNLLLVTSANGIEVGLLGCRDSSGDTPTWVQYTLLDEARIEMPLTAEKDETFPIGFGLDTSSSHRLVVNDNQLPVMPMIHIISTNGLLLTFNFLNLTPGAADICSPPPPISYSGQHFQLLSAVLSHSTEEATNINKEEKTAASTSATPANLIASTPLGKDKTPTFFGGMSTAANQQPFEQLSNFGNIDKNTTNTTATPAGFGDGFSASSSAVGSLSFAGFGAQQQNTSQASLQSKPQFQPQTQQQQHQSQQQQHQLQQQQHQLQQQQHQLQQQQQQQQQQLQQQKQLQQSTSVVSGVKSSELNKPLYTVPPNFTPPSTSTTTNVQSSTAQSQKLQSNTLISSKMQKGFLELIAVQINSFDKEIKQSGIHSKGLLKNIGSPDEMRACTKRLNDLHELIEQADDREFEMDVQNLRHTLNEARFMVAECRWKLDKHKNPDLPRLGNSTADAANRRQLAKLQSYMTANEAQMQLLKYLIDVQWSNFQDTVRRNTKSQIHIPCLDGIYERMTKMQETLVRQRNKLNRIKSKLQQNGLLHKVINSSDSSIVNGKHEVTMESLADSILSMTLAHVIDENRAKLSNEKLNAIREFTRQRSTVNIIKPHRPNRVGLRSEVVLESMLQSERSKIREALTANKAADVAKPKQEAQKITKEPLIPKPTATKPLNYSQQLQFVSNTTAATSFIKPMPNTAMQTGPSQDFRANQTQQQTPLTISFKAPVQVSSGFGAPNTNAIASSIEASKIGLTTTEGELPSMPQSPISFAAKVIGGTGAINKQNNALKTATATNITTSADKELKKLEETVKPFSFAPTSGAGSIFSGLGSIGSANDSTPKPFSFDTKSTASFSFGGFTATKTDTTTQAPSSIAATTTTKPALATGLFSGFGKPVGAENATPTTVPLNLSQAASNTSKQPLMTMTVGQTTATTSNTSTTSVPVLATSSTNEAVTSSAADPNESSLGDLVICKPTTKPTDATKPGANLFSGFGAVSSSFSFTPVSGNSSFSFSDLSKSIATSTTATTQPVAALTTSTTSTTTTNSFAKDTTATTVAPTTSAMPTPKTTEFSSSLDALGTTVSAVTASTAETTEITTPAGSVSKTTLSTAPSTTTTTTTAKPTGLFAAVTSSSGVTPAPQTTAAQTSIFGSVGLTAATTKTSPAVVSSSAAAPSSVGIFSSVAMPPASTTATPLVSSSGSLFASVPPPPAAAAATSTTSLTSTFGSFGVGSTPTSTPAAASAATTPTTTSIFANATANAPAGGSIFGGLPKPEQSVFASVTAANPQTTTTGIFAAAAQNASPFAAATNTSPPPNQTVTSGGGIFGSSFSFGKPAATGSIFGGSAAGTASAGSPFRGTAATTPAATTGGSIFGKPAGESVGIFGGVTNQQAASPAASGGSIFGQNVFGTATTGAASPPSGLFASAAQTESPAFGASGASLFGVAGANTIGTSGGPLFGAAAPVAPSAFGSPSGTTGPTGFGAFSQPNTASPFSSPNSANAAPFGQAAGVPVAQTGFGSPQQASAFSKPVFGGPATFGSPPAFGAQPTFGGAATFGPPKSPFSSFASPAATSPTTGVFGAPTQQNNLFETLGSTDTGLSFGNLAQGASGNAPKPAFGGSSFTSYRS